MVISEWILCHQLFIAVFGIVVHKGQQSFLQCHIAPLRTQTEKTFNLVNFVAQFVPVAFRQVKHVGISDTVDTDRGPCAILECIIIRCPPGWHGELEDKHPHVVIYKKWFQATFNHKVFTLYFITFLKNDLTFPIGLRFKKMKKSNRTARQSAMRISRHVLLVSLLLALNNSIQPECFWFPLITLYLRSQVTNMSGGYKAAIIKNILWRYN